MLNFNFDDNVNRFLKIIAKSASVQNIRVFFVGGAVRDNFLGIDVKDVDILIEGSAIEFARTLPDCIKLKSLHEDFDTCKVVFEDKVFDMASTRKESYPYSGCLPVVDEVGVKIEEDCLRRDFTVNSLYCEFSVVNDNLFYKVYDFANGIEDIETKILKSLHQKSYIDDPTRILRGLGFKYRFGFEFSAEDKKLINDYMLNIDRNKMSIDRAFSVLEKLLEGDYGKCIFKEVVNNEYLKIFTSENLLINIEKVFSICDLLGLNNYDFASFCINVIKNQDIDKYSFKSKADMFKLFSRIKASDLAYYYYKTLDDNVIYFKKNENIRLLISGNDLIQLGYPKDKKIGLILDSLFEVKIGKIADFKTKTDEINWVKNNFPLF